ncbi:RNA polymerase rpb4 domain-containing protein [Sarocladium implicatum]|nr:RNA polymerase rpb4 domain-containing protein [Sarocladium implicatum]
MSSGHPRNSRPKPPPPGKQQATETLNLGEFSDTETLTYSEASLILNALMTKRRNDRKDPNATEVLTQTLGYLDHFARFRVKENVEAVERLLKAHKPTLENFERAQLGSLCCEQAEEAKTLIPSLANKISDEDLDELLIELAKLQNQ